MIIKLVEARAGTPPGRDPGREGAHSPRMFRRKKGDSVNRTTCLELGAWDLEFPVPRRRAGARLYLMESWEWNCWSMSRADGVMPWFTHQVSSEKMEPARA